MQEIFEQNPVYASLAFIGTFLYILKMALFFISGDGESDLDADTDPGDGGASFSLISTQSILAFLMGAGWIGLAAKNEWMLNDTYSILSASVFGFAMMFFSAILTFKIKKLNAIPTINIKEALGKSGRAYTNIPAKGNGIGQVEITVGNKQQILQASSSGEAINSFDSVIVEKVDDSGNLIVKKS